MEKSHYPMWHFPSIFIIFHIGHDSGFTLHQNYTRHTSDITITTRCECPLVGDSVLEYPKQKKDWRRCWLWKNACIEEDRKWWLLLCIWTILVEAASVFLSIFTYFYINGVRTIINDRFGWQSRLECLLLLMRKIGAKLGVINHQTFYVKSIINGI